MNTPSPRVCFPKSLFSPWFDKSVTKMESSEFVRTPKKKPKTNLMRCTAMQITITSRPNSVNRLCHHIYPSLTSIAWWSGSKSSHSFPRNPVPLLFNADFANLTQHRPNKEGQFSSRISWSNFIHCQTSSPQTHHPSLSSYDYCE